MIINNKIDKESHSSTHVLPPLFFFFAFFAFFAFFSFFSFFSFSIFCFSTFLLVAFFAALSSTTFFPLSGKIRCVTFGCLRSGSVLLGRYRLLPVLGGWFSLLVEPSLSPLSSSSTTATSSFCFFKFLLVSLTKMLPANGSSLLQLLVTRCHCRSSRLSEEITMLYRRISPVSP